jgi:hypothetical protein
MEGNGFGIIEILFPYLLGETVENHENSISIAGVPTEIRIEHLRNMSQGRYL